MSNWRSKQAQNLVRHYLQHKQEATRKHKLLKQPKFIAGNLLTAYGTQALGAYNDAQQRLGKPFPKQVGKLLRDALNAELRAVHGRPTCVMCGEQAEPDAQLVDWLMTSQSLKWCCLKCVKAGKAKEGEELPGSQLLQPGHQPDDGIDRYEEID